MSSPSYNSTHGFLGIMSLLGAALIMMRTRKEPPKVSMLILPPWNRWATHGRGAMWLGLGFCAVGVGLIVACTQPHRRRSAMPSGGPSVADRLAPPQLYAGASRRRGRPGRISTFGAFVRCLLNRLIGFRSRRRHGVTAPGTAPKPLPTTRGPGDAPRIHDRAEGSSGRPVALATSAHTGMG